MIDENSTRDEILAVLEKYSIHPEFADPVKKYLWYVEIEASKFGMALECVLTDGLWKLFSKATIDERQLVMNVCKLVADEFPIGSYGDGKTVEAWIESRRTENSEAGSQAEDESIEFSDGSRIYRDVWIADVVARMSPCLLNARTGEIFDYADDLWDEMKRRSRR